MTREEAIEIIREHGISYIPRNTEIFAAVDTAWTIAIKNLEAWDFVIAEIEDFISNLEDSDYKDGCIDILNIINSKFDENNE